MMASASAHNNVITIAVRIFGALEGLRPKAEMLANPAAAITAIGPKRHSEKMIVSDRLRLMKGSGWLDQSCHPVPLNLDDPSLNRQVLVIINDHLTRKKSAYDGPMKRTDFKYSLLSGKNNVRSPALEKGAIWSKNQNFQHHLVRPPFLTFVLFRQIEGSKKPASVVCLLSSKRFNGVVIPPPLWAPFSATRLPNLRFERGGGVMPLPLPSYRGLNRLPRTALLAPEKHLPSNWQGSAPPGPCGAR